MKIKIREGREQIVLSQSELIEYLKNTFPGVHDFEVLDPTTVMHWYNGHCFFWGQSKEGWSCEEL